MERVLIMDPSQILRSQWKRALSRAGYEVVEVESGSQLFQHLIHGQIDLIIMELHLEQERGFQLIKLLKKSPLYADIPIMVASEEKRRTHIEEVLQLGIVDYLLKPFTTTRLVSRVQHVTAQFKYA